MELKEKELQLIYKIKPTIKGLRYVIEVLEKAIEIAKNEVLLSLAAHVKNAQRQLTTFCL
jgi:hypothetical protein